MQALAHVNINFLPLFINYDAHVPSQHHLLRLFYNKQTDIGHESSPSTMR